MPTQPAILGTARLGNFRLGYNPATLAQVRAARVRVAIGGVFANSRVRMAGLLVHDAINDEPNTCSLVVDGTRPSEGQDLRVSVNSDAPRLLFNGTLQTVDETYEGKPHQLAWACTAVDDLTRLNRIRPFGTWTTVSATTIAQALLADFAPGFTGAHIEAALPSVSIIFDGSDTFSRALARLAEAVGGYFYVEDLDLHLFLEETTDLPADIDATDGRLLNDPPITMRRDDSQLRTRVYGKGHGETLITDVAALETLLPINNAAMFNPAGGQVIASTTPDGAQSEILNYTGVEVGGGGSLVGPGAAPTALVSVAGVFGTALDAAALYQYAYTFVTASGESLASPLRSFTSGSAVAGPTASYSVSVVSGAPIFGTGQYIYGISWEFSGALRTPIGSLESVLTNAATASRIDLGSIPQPPVGAVNINIWRSTLSGYSGIASLKLVATVAAGTLTYQDTTLDGALGASAHTVATATQRAVSIRNIPTGQAGVTNRKLYRTEGDGAQLKLLHSLGDNTTTVYADATADGALGANAPVSDGSGLTQPDGQINPGATSILVAGLAPFNAAGGWWFTGTQAGRYTGFTGSSLTGVTGLVQALTYNTVIAAAPALVGVTGNTLPMLKGTPAHIWVERNDLAAQAILIALDAAQGRTSDGVVEHVISDQRRGEASLIALCDADLERFSRPIVTVTFDSRDTKLKSGKPITFNLASPAIAATLTLMSVDVSEIDIVPAGLAPRFHCVASSTAVSLESLLRKLLTKVA